MDLRADLETRTTDELLAIWHAPDGGGWPADAFPLIRAVLSERGVHPPPRGTPAPTEFPWKIVVIVAACVMGLLVAGGVVAGIMLKRAVHEVMEGTESIRARIEIAEIEAELERYRIHRGAYPTTREGLLTLRTWVENAAPRRPGRKREELSLEDPWGRSYVYTSDGETYRLITWGADGVPGGEGRNADIRARPD